MKVLLIPTDSHTRDTGYGGVAYYRLVGPAKAVNETSEHEFVFSEKLKAKTDLNELVRGFDLVICKHLDNAGAAKKLRIACETHRIPLVYDLDDNLLAIRSDQPAFEKGYAAGQLKRVLMATNLSFADAFFVSTEPLKEVYESFYREVFGVEMPIFVLSNFNDASLFEFDNLENKRGVCIGYQGSMTHDSDIKMVLPAIDRVMDKYKNVRLELVGSVRRESIPKLFDSFRNRNRVLIGPGTATYNEFPEFLMKRRWDIGIAPLIDDEFNRGKSHIKYMEFAMKKIPTVASDVYPYTHNAREALLVKTEDEWVEALTDLIENPKKRKRIGERAYNHVVSDCQYKDHAALWIEACEAVTNQAVKKQKLA